MGWRIGKGEEGLRKKIKENKERRKQGTRKDWMH